MYDTSTYHIGHMFNMGYFQWKFEKKKKRMMRSLKGFLGATDPWTGYAIVEEEIRL